MKKEGEKGQNINKKRHLFPENGRNCCRGWDWKRLERGGVGEEIKIHCAQTKFGLELLVFF